MGVDLTSLLCGRRLVLLRQKVAYDVGTTGVITALPIVVFLLLTTQQVDSFLDAYDFLDCTTAETKTGAFYCFFRNGLWRISLPTMKVLLYPLEASYRFLQKDDLFMGIHRGTILTIGLVLCSAAFLSSSAYASYRMNNLHFRYVLKSRSQVDRREHEDLGISGAWSSQSVFRDDTVCIEERIEGSDEAKGVDCNPGLASSKANHLRSVIGMLKRFSAGKSCRPGSNEVHRLDHVKAHMTVAAKWFLDRVQTNSFVYKCMAVSIAVCAGIITVQALWSISREVFATTPLGSRSIKIAFITFALAMIVLIGTTINIALKRKQEVEKTVGDSMARLYSKVDECTDDGDTCRKAIEAEVGEGDLMLGRALDDTLPNYSPRLLAAATVVASIIALVVIVRKMGFMRTSRGVRALQSGTMRQYASGKAILENSAKDVADAFGARSVVGGAVISHQAFMDRLGILQSMIGESIPVSHVVGWATAVSALSATVAATGWREMINTLDSM